MKKNYNFFMINKKLLSKLEDDLGHYLIDEFTKSDPTKRTSSEMYKYKGLAINPKEGSSADKKTILVRIGVLEAEFKIDNGSKTTGALSPEEERHVMLWITRSEVQTSLKSLFDSTKEFKAIPIVPFDLEKYYGI